VSAPDWVKVFASAEAAHRWFDKGVAWEYEIEGGQRQSSVWIYLADENSRAIGDASWVRLFASKEAADANGTTWLYPVDE
jgi:hypothetical protein